MEKEFVRFPYFRMNFPMFLSTVDQLIQSHMSLATMILSYVEAVYKTYTVKDAKDEDKVPIDTDKESTEELSEEEIERKYWLKIQLTHIKAINKLLLIKDSVTKYANVQINDNGTVYDPFYGQELFSLVEYNIDQNHPLDYNYEYFVQGVNLLPKINTNQNLTDEDIKINEFIQKLNAAVYPEPNEEEKKIIQQQQEAMKKQQEQHIHHHTHQLEKEFENISKQLNAKFKKNN